MDRRLIINADDFGLCSGVNKAVAKAHTDGVLTSATIIANMPAIRFAFEPAAVCRPPWPLPDKGGGKKAGINRLQCSNLLKTDMLVGIAHTGKISVDFLKAVTLLYNSGATVEVMTHPGFAEGLNSDKTRLIQQREAELDAFCDKRTKQYFKDAGIKLVRYDQL